MKLILKNGTLIDGFTSEKRKCSIIIDNGIIEDIAPVETEISDGEIIDISGKIICPGFVDIHAHGDLEPLVTPDAESKILNGVTTEVCGNCGSSPFPIINHCPGYLREKADSLGVDINWTDANGFFSEVQKKKCSINRLFLLGHGRMRSAVRGNGSSKFGKKEIEEMCEITESAMQAGAWGLSTGLAYVPGFNAETDELIELCKVVASYDGIYSTHLRSEGDSVIEAVTEALEISRKSGVRLQLSHLKISRETNWHKLDKLKNLLFSASKEGINFGADWYPYQAWSANLDSILPDWVYEGGTTKLLSRLRDPKLRKKLAKYVIDATKRGMSWDKVIVGTVTMDEHRRFQGRSIAEIAEELSLSPEDTYFNLILAEGGRADGLITTMSKDVQYEIISWPFVSVCSDATARLFDEYSKKNHYHPRTFGTTSRFLKLVREENILPLTEAIKRLTSLPASQLGLKNRGIIKKGMVADIVVFDFETIKDTATFANPVSKPMGINYVFVNGVMTVKNSELCGAYCGKLLRKNYEA